MFTQFAHFENKIRPVLKEKITPRIRESHAVKKCRKIGTTKFSITGGTFKGSLEKNF